MSSFKYNFKSIKRTNYLQRLSMPLIHIDNFSTKELEIYKNMRNNVFNSENSFIADSPKVVNLLLQEAIEVKSILATQEYYDEFSHLITDETVCYVASKELMQTIVGHKIHHNCMLHGVRPESTQLSNLDDQIIMLDGITSNENVGAIARSAAALGVNSYLLPSTSPHPYSRRSLRVSMGYMSRLKYHIYEDIVVSIKYLQSMGYKIYAAEVTMDSSYLQDVKPAEKWVILVGHEGKGIAKEILELCDEIVSIEMVEGVKSFNVSMAATLMMYKFMH